MSDQPTENPAPVAPDARPGEHPGARLDGTSGDEDEFAGVPSPPRRRPWLSAVVIALAVYLVIHQRADFVYALSSSSPRNLGDAATTLKNPVGGLPVNRYVRLSGTADFESGVILDTKGDWNFRQFFRLRGTASRLFVQRVADPLPIGLAERPSFAGRLIRLADLSFSDSIRDYYSRTVTATHFFTPDALRVALAGAQVPLAVADRAGESLVLQQNELLMFAVESPGHARIFIPKEWWPDVGKARARLEKSGAKVLSGAPALPAPGRADGFMFEVELAGDTRATVMSAIADIAPQVRIQPHVDEIEARVADVKTTDAGFDVTSRHGRALSIRNADLRSIRTTAAVAIPDDALLLIEGERPAQHYRAIVAAAFLVAFAFVNLLALYKGA